MKLSVVVPCYNEEATLEKCIRKLLEIEDDSLILEVIIVNDGSSDKSPAIAQELHKVFQNIRVVSHKENAGKGCGTAYRIPACNRGPCGCSGCGSGIRSARP